MLKEKAQLRAAKHARERIARNRKKKDREEDDEYRQQLIMKIGKYQSSERFGSMVKKDLKINHSNSALNNQKTPTLESHLVRIRFQLDQKSTDKFLDGLAHNGIAVIEKTVSPMYECEGLSASINDNDEFWDCFERYKCELQLPHISPLLQMSMILTSTVVVQHEINRKANNAPRREFLRPETK